MCDHGAEMSHEINGRIRLRFGSMPNVAAYWTDTCSSSYGELEHEGHDPGNGVSMPVVCHSRCSEAGNMQIDSGDDVPFKRRVGSMYNAAALWPR